MTRPNSCAVLGMIPRCVDQLEIIQCEVDPRAPQHPVSTFKLAVCSLPRVGG
jgi:hypothetical protein